MTSASLSPHAEKYPLHSYLISWIALLIGAKSETTKNKQWLKRSEDLDSNIYPSVPHRPSMHLARSSRNQPFLNHPGQNLFSKISHLGILARPCPLPHSESLRPAAAAMIPRCSRCCRGRHSGGSREGTAATEGATRQRHRSSSR